MNFRTTLKNTIRTSQNLFKNANPNNSVTEWFGRNQYVKNLLKNYGLTGDFFDVLDVLKARDPNGKLLKGSAIYRIGKAALKQGKLADLRKMREYFITGMGVQNMKFEGRSLPIYDVNKAVKFNTVNKMN